MAKPVYTDLDLDQNEIKNVSLDKQATVPGSPVEGQFWYNESIDKAQYRDASATQTIASESFVQTAIQQIGQSQGAYDASSGALPTNANLIDGDTVIRRGDYWDISVAGTITGIGGADELSVGDVLKFVGTNPAIASQWIGIQRNLNDSLIGNVKSERQTVNLVANTPLVVAAASISDIFSIQVYNSSNAEIIIDIAKNTNANQRVLTSKRSLTGVIVELLGAVS